MSDTKHILEVNNLSVEINTVNGIVRPVRNLSLSLGQGEILAVVGESGCGKSMLCKAIANLLPTRAKITDGTIVSGNSISMIFQDPMSSLDPTMRIGDQIVEAIQLHHPSLTKQKMKEMAIGLLQDVGIEHAKERYDVYPYHLSGGMRQRCVIAIALATSPKILIADEPTTALDVTVQAQIISLLDELRKKKNLSILFISHDLSLVSQIADRLAIMYAGEIVEYGKIDEVLNRPKHPYTLGLLSALPMHSHDGHLHPIPGSPPSLKQEIIGDAFASRNPMALGIDFVQKPPFFQISDTHYAASWLLDPRAKNIMLPTHDVQEHAFTERKIRKVTNEIILDVQNISHTFLLSENKKIHAVDDVSFTIGRGEIFALVGESGSGKSTIARLIMNMYPIQKGKMIYDGMNLSDSAQRKTHKKSIQKDIQIIMQDSSSALNERMKVRDIIEEPLKLNHVFQTKEEMKSHIVALLHKAKLDEDILERYPSELSGGERQRVAIIRAFSVHPKLIIADEPFASLDVSVQAQIVNLFLELIRTNNTSVLFIAHDLSMVKFLSDRVGVMRHGKLVEIKQTDTIFTNPEHPYTKQLLQAIPTFKHTYKAHFHHRGEQ